MSRGYQIRRSFQILKEIFASRGYGIEPEELAELEANLDRSRKTKDLFQLDVSSRRLRIIYSTAHKLSRPTSSP